MKTSTAQADHPWSKNALLTKAQRYAEEMLTHPRNEWKFAFWSSLTLEILARAALANISPTLLAESNDWNHLYYALGHTPKISKFIPKSVDITNVLKKLGVIIPTFDNRLEGFGAMHLSRRNDELHSGNTPFDNIGSAEWLPLFYETCDVLLKSFGEKLETLVGTAEALAAMEMIAAAKDDSAKAVLKNISAHKTIWLESRTAEERVQSASQAAIWAARQTGHRVTCPACQSNALVTGSPLAPPTQKLKNELIVETQTFLPVRFECVACGLKISGLPQLHASGLANTFTATFHYDPVQYYGAQQDTLAEFEDDNNER